MPQVPHSAALMPTSPTSTPLKYSACQLVEDTVCESTPRSAPAIACWPMNRAASQPCSRKPVYSVQRVCTTNSARGSSRSGTRLLNERSPPAPWQSITTTSVAPAGERAPHRGVELLGVEDPAFLVPGLAGHDLVPPADAGDALHVADDEDLHRGSTRKSPARICSKPSTRGPCTSPVFAPAASSHHPARRVHRPQVIPIEREGGKRELLERDELLPQLWRAHQRPRALLLVLRGEPGRVPAPRRERRPPRADVPDRGRDPRGAAPSRRPWSRRTRTGPRRRSPPRR